MDLALSATNPKRLVEEALESIVMPENIRVVNLTLDEPDINIDIQMMKRVIINLVNNAIDAMTGGGEITIKSNVTEDDYELHITDTGVGIQDDILEKIWNPLFTTKAKGMGFGLSICKRVLEYQRGSITVKSKVGEGTTFIIKLPLTR
jgi:signal transduction histidine kinase